MSRSSPPRSIALTADPRTTDARSLVGRKLRALGRALGLALAGSLGLFLLLLLAVHLEDALRFSLNATSAMVHAAGLCAPMRRLRCLGPGSDGGCG